MTTRVADKLHLFSKERDSKPNTRKRHPSDNKLSQKNKQFIFKHITGEGYRILEGKTNYYYSFKSIGIHFLNK